MTEREFYKLIGDRMGYQAYVQTTYKPVEQPQRDENPFSHPPTTPRDLWYLHQAEVGITTLFGQLSMGRGKSWDDTFADLKHNHPYLFP